MRPKPGRWICCLCCLKSVDTALISKTATDLRLKNLADALDMQPSDEISGFLIQVESAKLALLEWELEEAMRKTAWTTRPEIKGSEQSAWH
ncbi:MAG: hypothetical protein WB792_15595, partial [Desulfobacterales bacterium]